MTRTRIKICGIRTTAMAKAAADAGADAVGLVFVAKSPRFVTMDEAKEVIDALPAFVQPVGLFVNVAPEQVMETAKELGLQAVQLHGDETPQYAESLAPLRVIKGMGFHVEKVQEQLSAWSAVKNVAAVIFDTPPAPADRADDMTGGSGVAFDWGPLAEVQSDIPIILAGGLTPSNVEKAIHTAHPYAVDVSSGVESERGVKDAGMIKDFITAVRNADSSQ